MNLKKRTGIDPGDFATGIVLYHHLHEDARESIDPLKFHAEKHSGPVVGIEESIDDGIQVKIEDEDSHGHQYNYRYDFEHIFAVECVCGNQKLFHSGEEKWVCPWCEDD